ncbi:MAG: copper chaperone PCu(A)C [Ardenticatenaceae bacterium]|nr:copper chaperone PCu(A)C [Anaerolineales bacterium]MCB8918015.1 copper chaperone PCu(A)C [Ardenticatenaceae bacterium]
MKRLSMLLLMLLLALVLVGCGSPAGELDINDVWGRTSPAAAENGAFYMTITNNLGEDEQLLGASSAACGMTELHEMYMKEQDVMGMRPVEGGVIPIPAGETVTLKVGGLHVMCMGKTQEFNPGDEIPITLTFAVSGTREVMAEIRDVSGDQ